MYSYLKKFTDFIKIYCRSGNGGSGIIHFRKEKFINRGGPDGGDGGKGGNIIIRGNNKLFTISHLKSKKHIIAENGETGGRNRITGSNGKDSIIEVPIGTIVKDICSNIIIEILNNNEEKILLFGGKGGKGNCHFKNSLCQTPFYSEKGESGKEFIFVLELKLLADVGLIGLPNSGKSTLISMITSSKPKIDNYPFTTLNPKIGVINYKNFKKIVIADIPGIIKGASKGKGLGFEFLKHIQRNKILFLILSAEVIDYKKSYNLIRNELIFFDKNLFKKKRLLVISKYDLLDQELKDEIIKELPIFEKYIFISSFSKEGLYELIYYICNILS
ncbi:GTPase ObgE [Candidatus Karelsulcia muelleri]|uniref:GTPase ObgE n=1 Tax=Candidatus Karelsulcia muelleri TaxID=336810 RepID=UPI00216A09D4|nr:GTPase ObgE [Candidatus Karelsulcia muelleri]